MADYTGGARVVSDRDAIVYSKTDVVPSHRIYDALTAFEEDVPAIYRTPPEYYQRVFDTGLGVWCYYTKFSIDPSPLSSETTPNWTGPLLAGAHDVLRIY